jgi:hypothetical protein
VAQASAYLLKGERSVKGGPRGRLPSRVVSTHREKPTPGTAKLEANSPQTRLGKTATYGSD